MHYPNQESRKGIVWKEYGRNVQKIVDHILTIDDKEKRTHYAYICIELMRQLNPSTKDAQDHTTKLWDHLFIMADFKLDVDAPYSMPDPSILGKKPNRVPYSTHRLAYKHYGRNIELVVKGVQAMESGPDKDDAIIYLARLMKKSYMTWNKENVEDVVILEHLKELSKGNLSLDAEKVQNEKLLDIQIKDLKTLTNRSVFESSSPSGRSGNGGNNRKNGNGSRGNGPSKTFKKR